MIFHLLIRVYSAQSYYTLQGVLLHLLHYRFEDIPCHNVRLTCQSFLVFYLSPFLINGITVPEIIELWRITTVSTICKRFSLKGPRDLSSFKLTFSRFVLLIVPLVPPSYKPLGPPIYLPRCHVNRLFDLAFILA